MGKGSSSVSQLRIILVIVIGVLAVILAFQNREPVETRFLMFRMEMPRFVLLLLTTGIGFVAGFLLGTYRRRRD